MPRDNHWLSRGVIAWLECVGYLVVPFACAGTGDGAGEGVDC